MDILDKNIPEAHLATFITFRTYGTWLHGDERGSIDRYTNAFGEPRLPPNRRRRETAFQLMSRSAVTLDRAQRQATDSSIRETCAIRGWSLHAVNVRTNHVHIAVSATAPPKRLPAVFKANATRAMREAGCWNSTGSPWSRGASAKRVWSESELEAVVYYIVEQQGDDLCEIELSPSPAERDGE